MARPRKSVLDKITVGTYRPSRDGAALVAELGVATLEDAYAQIGYEPAAPRKMTDAPLVEAVYALTRAIERLANEVHEEARCSTRPSLN